MDEDEDEDIDADDTDQQPDPANYATRPVWLDDFPLGYRDPNYPHDPVPKNQRDDGLPGVLHVSQNDHRRWLESLPDGKTLRKRCVELLGYFTRSGYPRPAAALLACYTYGFRPCDDKTADAIKVLIGEMAQPEPIAKVDRGGKGKSSKDKSAKTREPDRAVISALPVTGTYEEAVEWAASNASKYTLQEAAKRAPSTLAYAMLEFAKSNKAKFYGELLPKTAKAKSEKDSGQLRDIDTDPAQIAQIATALKEAIAAETARVLAEYGFQRQPAADTALPSQITQTDGENATDLSQDERSEPDAASEPQEAVVAVLDQPSDLPRTKPPFQWD